MRRKTKSKKLNNQRIKQINKQIHKKSEDSKKNPRKKMNKQDLEKAAIVYLHLFTKRKDTQKIDYSSFYDTWVKWFPVDSYGCGNVIKKSFNKIVECAGNTKESIQSYRDSTRIFNVDDITKDDMEELRELATKKGCFIETTKDLGKNLSGFCVKKIAPRNYQFRKSNILLGEKYECSYRSVKKYLLNLPDIDDLKAAQDHLKSILIANTTIKERIKAIEEYPYYVSTYDFDLYLDRFVRKCDSLGVLEAALQLCNKLHVLNTVNEKPIDARANMNAKKSLEQLGLFAYGRITRKMIATCIRKSGISEDCTEWTNEDFSKFTDELSNNYSAKYQYIRDRYPKLKDYKLWILSSYTGKNHKTLEKEMKDFLE